VLAPPLGACVKQWHHGELGDHLERLRLDTCTRGNALDRFMVADDGRMKQLHRIEPATTQASRPRGAILARIVRRVDELAHELACATPIDANRRSLEQRGVGRPRGRVLGWEIGHGRRPGGALGRLKCHVQQLDPRPPGLV